MNIIEYQKQKKKETKKKESEKTYTLHQMRKESGVSGTYVAKQCDVSYRSLRNWEDGTTIPNVIVLLEILSHYGFTIDQLDLTPFIKDK